MAATAGAGIPIGSLRYRVIASGGLALIAMFESLVRRVAATPAFHDPDDFSWVADVEEQWRDVCDELGAVLEQADAVPAFEDISQEQARLVRPGTWKTFLFHAFGAEVPENCRRCPKTAALLAAIPGMTLGMFSILEPRARIAPHRGVYNGVLRYHLALVVPSQPERCGLRIGREVRHWKEGKSLVFDDTQEHEAWNDSDERRIVLFVDFLRELPRPLSWLNRLLLVLIRRSPYVQNMLANLAALEGRAR